MSTQPTWTEWTLDPEFFTALNNWTRRYPDNRLDRILQSFSEKAELGKPLLEAIPDGPVPIRGLVKALVHLVQLAGTLPAKRKDLREFIDDILAWVEAISQAFQDGLPGTFVENTWKDMTATRDLINEACLWAAQEMNTSKKLSSKIRLLAIDEKIAEFRRRWDIAHIRFSSVSGVRLAQGNDAILKEIRELPLGPGLQQIQTDITTIRQQLCEIATAQDNLTSLSVEIPAPPAVFHGRSEIVDALGNVLSGAENEMPNIALLGPGGIGKTSIAKAVINRDELVEVFGQRRHWVPCDQVPNISLLLHYIVRNLRIIPASTDDLLKTIIAHLKKDARPRLIVIDNFESLWDREESRVSSENVLSQLASLRRVSILLTVRGTAKPPGVRWKLANSLPAVIPPMSPEAARMTFEEISPYVDDDLDELLQELDHVPLAVTLVAKVGESGLYPSELLTEWRTSGTTFLSLHPDRNSSVDISIRFSLQSTRLLSNPEALRLLSILSLLPGGIRYGNLNSIAPLLTRTWDAEVTLLRTCLAYRSTNRSLQASDLEELKKFYYALAAKGAENPGSSTFNRDVHSLSLEEGNLGAILIRTFKDPDPPVDALQATLCYLNYQFWNNPNVELADRLVRGVRSHSDEGARGLLPLCLLWLGKLHDRTSNHTLAIDAFEEAEGIFVSFKNHKAAGEVCYAAGNVHRVEIESDRSLTLFERAIAHFEASSSLEGIAKSYCSQGLVHFNHHRHEKALELLDKARQLAEKVEDRQTLMKCLMTAGHILRGTRSHEAIQMLRTAREYYLEFGPRYYADICLYHIAIANTALRKYEEAFGHFKEALAGFEEGKSTDQVGYCLFHWAEANREADRDQDAMFLFKRGEKHWQSKGNILQQVFCMRGQFRIAIKLGNANQTSALGDRALKILAKSSKHPHYLLLARIEVKAGVAQAHLNRARVNSLLWLTAGARATLVSFVTFVFPVFGNVIYSVYHHTF